MTKATNKETHLVRSTLLPYGKQWLEEEDIDAVLKVLKSDFITQGPEIDRFEKKIANYVGAKYAVAFCNGTAALHGACFAAGIGPGDEVITTPITFLASSNCVLYMGAKPVFADIDPFTYNISPEQIRDKITPRTKAIIPVDFTGQPAEMDRIERIARNYGLTIIHDAAHSLGATYDDCKVGTFGDMTMFSFHPVKHITTGEGGMIVTDNENLYQRLLLFRNHGTTRDEKMMKDNDGPWYYEMQELGYNYRMTDIQAALGTTQIDKLDYFVSRRREIAAQYNQFFSTMPSLIIPYQHMLAYSSWHLYVLGWKLEQFTVSRKEIFEALRAENIGVNVHYIPIYKQPYYRDKGYSQDSCPNAEQYYQSVVSLPIFPKMLHSDIKDVIQAVSKVYQQFIK